MGSTAEGSPVNTNLVFIRKSRPRLQAGDVFAFKIVEGPYRFGRVILVDVADAPMPGSNLVYIYAATSSDLSAPPMKDMTPDRLLTAPIWTNKQGWLRGYFVNVARTELSADDELPRYCFLDVVLSRRRYVDLHGQPIAERLEPCGKWGLHSHLGVDDIVSKALGLPPASD